MCSHYRDALDADSGPLYADTMHCSLFIITGVIPCYWQNMTLFGNLL